MDFERALKILQKAGQDEASVRLASVDLQFPELPEVQRARLREALEASAVPHWFDNRILRALLGIGDDEVALIAAQLRQLPVVESFSARGADASNVHEKSRKTIRSRIRNESPERFRALSIAARSCFAGEEPYLRIEALYHHFAIDPQAASIECANLSDGWLYAGRSEAKLALSVALDELLQEGLPAGFPRGVAFLCLGRMRYDYQPLEVTTRQGLAALAEFESVNELWRIANTQTLLGDVEMVRQNLKAALGRYQSALAILERLAIEKPSAAVQRNISISYENIGDTQRAEEDLAGALKSYQDSLAIREKLTRDNPTNDSWQSDLAWTFRRVGQVLESQDQLNEALANFRRFNEILQTLTAKDRENTAWQWNLAVSNGDIGRILEKQGDPKGALDALQRFREIMGGLVALDPTNAGWQRDLAAGYESGAELHRSQGDLGSALNGYRASLAIRERLAQDDRNPNWDSQLACTYWQTGVTLAQAEPNANDEARVLFEKARDLLRRIKSDSGLTSQQQDMDDAVQADLQKL